MKENLEQWLTLVDAVGLVLGILLVFGLNRSLGKLLDSFLLILLLGGLGAGTRSLALWGTESQFAVLRMWCHVLFCVFAPLLILRGLHHLLARKKNGSVAFAVPLLVLGLSMEGLYVFARRVEPFRLQLSRYELQSELLLGLEQPIHVVILADLQTDAIGGYEERVFHAIDQEEADLLLLAGDYLQIQDEAARASEREKLARLFGTLEHKPRLGIFAVDGDIDEAEDSLAGTGVRCLKDETVKLGRRLQLMGLSLGGSRTELNEDELKEITRFGGLTIVLGHSPDFFLPVIRDRISYPALFVAGHTHGGQVVLPFGDPLLTLSELPPDYARGGFFKAGETWMVLSRGVGMERGYAPRIRFNCPPELVVLDLFPATTQ